MNRALILLTSVIYIFPFFANVEYYEWFRVDYSLENSVVILIGYCVFIIGAEFWKINDRKDLIKFNYPYVFLININLVLLIISLFINCQTGLTVREFIDTLKGYSIFEWLIEVWVINNLALMIFFQGKYKFLAYITIFIVTILIGSKFLVVLFFISFSNYIFKRINFNLNLVLITIFFITMSYIFIDTIYLILDRALNPGLSALQWFTFATDNKIIGDVSLQSYVYQTLNKVGITDYKLDYANWYVDNYANITNIGGPNLAPTVIGELAMNFPVALPFGPILICYVFGLFIKKFIIYLTKIISKNINYKNLSIEYLNFIILIILGGTIFELIKLLILSIITLYFIKTYNAKNT